jgi:tetratricopeptide (TPR) repeat protein
MDLVIETSLKAAVKALQAGQPDTALDSLARALDRAKEKDDGEALMLVYGLLAPTFRDLGQREKAIKCAQKAVDLAAEHGDAEGRAHYQGLVDTLSGEDETGSGPELDSKPLTEDEVSLAFDRAEQALTLSQPEVAVQVLTPLVASAKDMGDKEVEASAAGMLAQAYLMLGYGEKAWELAKYALVIAKSMDDPEAVAHFQALADSLGGG